MSGTWPIINVEQIQFPVLCVCTEQCIIINYACVLLFSSPVGIEKWIRDRRKSGAMELIWSMKCLVFSPSALPSSLFPFLCFFCTFPSFFEHLYWKSCVFKVPDSMFWYMWWNGHRDPGCSQLFINGCISQPCLQVLREHGWGTCTWQEAQGRFTSQGQGQDLWWL